MKKRYFYISPDTCISHFSEAGDTPVAVGSAGKLSTTWGEIKKIWER